MQQLNIMSMERFNVICMPQDAMYCKAIDAILLHLLQAAAPNCDAAQLLSRFKFSIHPEGFAMFHMHACVCEPYGVAHCQCGRSGRCYLGSSLHRRQLKHKYSIMNIVYWLEMLEFKNLKYIHIQECHYSVCSSYLAVLFLRKNFGESCTPGGIAASLRIRSDGDPVSLTTSFCWISRVSRPFSDGFQLGDRSYLVKAFLVAAMVAKTRHVSRM